MSVDVLQKVTTVELMSLELDQIQYSQSRMMYVYGAEESTATNNDNQAGSGNNFVFVAFLAYGGEGSI